MEELSEAKTEEHVGSQLGKLLGAQNGGIFGARIGGPFGPGKPERISESLFGRTRILPKTLPTPFQLRLPDFFTFSAFSAIGVLGVSYMYLTCIISVSLAYDTDTERGRHVSTSGIGTVLLAQSSHL